MQLLRLVLAVACSMGSGTTLATIGEATGNAALFSAAAAAHAIFMEKRLKLM
jgi:hypothetical protein